MKIDKQTEEAKQLIKMLNEDLVSAKVNLEVPLTLKMLLYLRLKPSIMLILVMMIQSNPIPK